ncbi:phage tail tape measure protein [Rhizobium sp. SL86]|uniref:phage tail tape measure protein n=1 Tax=Rhizobium sp. SL86 TaxID=2995148 RepID=UPI002272A563|nr:phage tail tape measure protein [Rhizobium sp. SL86]MCY1664595.1 phage tail tape measure protein [Rhizobium sp. SL86]
MANRKIKAEVEIGAKDNTDKAFKSVALRMGQVERQISKFNKTASEFNRKVESINRATSGRANGFAWQQMKQVGSQMEAAAVAVRAGVAGIGAAAVGAGVKSAIVDFAALERQMTRIGLTAGVSKEETDEALQEMQRQAKALALPLSEVHDALQVMTSAGMGFKEAMAFLPSVLATTQAAGSSAAEMANTTVQAAGALKISANEMQRAFDIINEAGKAGSFEAKDMATYLPGFANSFAALGYTGTEAIGELSAYMQTLRAHTSNASKAATQMENILAKMNSEETRNRFKKFGINLEAEMKKRAAAGQKPLEAFIDLARKALKGDLSKISQLFGDVEYQQGMLSLIGDVETYRKVIAIINSSRVDGSVQRDNQRLLGETQATIDRLTESLNQLKTGIGAAIAPALQPLIDDELKKLDLSTALNAGKRKRGYSLAQQWNPFLTEEERMQLPYEGGYRDPAYVAEYWNWRYGRPEGDPSRPKASTGRQGVPVVLPEFPGGGRGYTVKTMPNGDAPIPIPRPSFAAGGARKPLFEPGLPLAEVQRQAAATPAYVATDLQAQYAAYGSGRQMAVDRMADLNGMNPFRGFAERLEAASAKTADSGEKAGQAIEKGAQALDESGSSLVDGLRSVIADFRQAIRELGATKVQVSGASAAGAAMGGMPGKPAVNADTGRSMPPEGFGPR